MGARATWSIPKLWPGLLEKNDYQIVQQPSDADVVLVNTCGFIGPAKEESIETILEISRLKEEGKVKKLVVAGLPFATLSGRIRQRIAGSGSFYRHR